MRPSATVCRTRSRSWRAARSWDAVGQLWGAALRPMSCSSPSTYAASGSSEGWRSAMARAVSAATESEMLQEGSGGHHQGGPLTASGPGVVGHSAWHCPTPAPAPWRRSPIPARTSRPRPPRSAWVPRRRPPCLCRRRRPGGTARPSRPPPGTGLIAATTPCATDGGDPMALLAVDRQARCGQDSAGAGPA